ncbi:MAG: hypothetical protein PVF17_00530 [Ignavibacteria bacterium]|jgi:hypothetical protein
MWIDYTIRQPTYGEVIFAEYVDHDSRIKYDHFLYTSATEAFDIIRWKGRSIVPVRGKLPAN